MSDRGKSITWGSVDPSFAVRYRVINISSLANEVRFLVPGEIGSYVLMGLKSQNLAFYYKHSETLIQEEVNAWQEFAVWHPDPSNVHTAYAIFSELVERAWDIVAPK